MEKKAQITFIAIFLIAVNTIIDAGILSQANDGLACVDEFDKMDDKNGFLEASENQTITITKANVHTTLTARTSLLACANPKKGRFDVYT